MRVFRIRLKIRGRNKIVDVNSINMIQLVAQCERSGIEYLVSYVAKI